MSSGLDIPSETSLQKDAANAQGGGSVTLLQFARRYAISSQLRNRMTLAVARLNQAQNEQAKDAAWTEISSLIEEISVQRSRATEAELEIESERRRNLSEVSAVHTARDIIFQSKDLGYEYPNGKFTLKGVDITLKEGEITGIFGKNANGKTTLFKLVVGQLAQTNGWLDYPSLDPNFRSKANWRKVKSDIAYVPQELPALYGTMEENLRFAAASHGILGSDNDLALEHIVARLDLTEYLTSKWSELSGGFKLRIALAIALISKPKLLALDEPLANLDYLSQLSVLRDIRNLASSFKDPIAVLITSQHLNEIEAIADKILFLERGEVLFYGEPGKVGGGSGGNLFELDIDDNEVALRRALPASKGYRVRHNGISYVVRSNVGVTSKEILGLLLEQGIVPSYFRNISNSVKQFFADTHFNDGGLN